MSRIILIDGENLVYGLRKLVGKDGNKASRDKLLGFDYRGLINEVLEDEQKAQIFFYGAKLRRIDHDPKLQKKTKDVIKWQSFLVNDLQKQGIQFVKVGNLRARETEPCIKMRSQ